MVVVLCMIASCTGSHVKHNAIARNDAYLLTGDSLIEGDIVATTANRQFIESTLTHERLDSIIDAYAHATGNDGKRITPVGGHPWHKGKDDERFPQYNSRERLVDAISAMSVDHIAAAGSGGGFDTQSDTLALCLAIYMSLAHLDAQRSMATLKAMVSNGRVQPFDSQHMSAARLAWAVAAWEVYTATASKQWLAYAHNVLDTTLSDDCAMLQDYTTHLMHGTTGYRAEALYPTWMQNVDIISTMPLMSNVLTWKAMNVLNDMDDELQASHRHPYDAARLKASINQQLWSEVRGRYSAYLYGNIYNLRAPITDNLAQALAVLWGIAEDDRAATLIKHTPVTLVGVPVLFPLNASIEPYFACREWPMAQALWVMAAAAVGNDDMVRAGMAALLRAQALFMSRHITPQGKPRNDLLTAAANQAIMLRVIMGINFVPDGIELNPHIPTALTGSRSLTGLHHGNAVINLTIVGNGNNLTDITIHGKSIEGNFVSSTGGGIYTVKATVKPGNMGTGLTVVTTSVAPPPPPDVMWMPDSGFVTDFVTGGRYMMVSNGRFSYSLTDIAFAIPETGNHTTELSVAMANKYGFSFMAQPHVIAAGDARSIALNNDTVITADIDVSHGGQYLLQVDYTNHTRNDALMVSVNTHPQGMLFMPATHGNESAHDLAAESTGKQMSNFVTVLLMSGHNVITLSRPHIASPAATAHSITIMSR